MVFTPFEKGIREKFSEACTAELFMAEEGADGQVLVT